MPMDIRREGQQLLELTLRDTLHYAELREAQRVATKLIAEAGKVAILVVLDGFEGWERGGEWGDVSFLVEHDSNIEKLAIVGEERWRDEVLVFTAAGLRRSPVRYFTDLASARAWLIDAAASSLSA
jgi:hypothetical protein